MARYTYTIPRDTKGEGKILMIFSKKSFIWTICFAGFGLITVYLICTILNHAVIGIIGTLLFGLVGFIISTMKMPNSQNFEILRKTGGKNIDEILIRYIKFRRKGKRLYLYYKGGEKNEQWDRKFN